MPRPGPRPYECVRRAWHSDRHQPMRGSIIQQIFRVVTEGHSSATRKNREWQEKLPRVVFKAEEIMYSKANSEAEYMNPDTLWERLNDAIDTIIRRDKSTETGQFLQPCVEAALVLGCVPVRASRSQRHSNPRSYLNPRFQESSQASPVSTDRTNDHRPPPQPPNPSGNQLAVSRSTMANQACSPSPFNNQTVKNSSYIAPHAVTHLQPSFPRPKTSMAVESNTPLDFGSVYPLYYGSHCHNTESQYGFRSPQNPTHNSVIIGTPVGWPVGQSSRFANTRNLLPDESTVMVSDKLRQVEPVDLDHHGNVAKKACDLSLRLGPSDPCTSVAEGLAYVTEEGGSSSHREIGKYSEPCDKNHEFCFFPTHDASNIPFESSNNRLEEKGEFEDQNTTLRKRKAQELEDGCTQWLPKLQPNPFGGQSRWPGL